MTPTLQTLWMSAKRDSGLHTIRGLQKAQNSWRCPGAVPSGGRYCFCSGRDPAPDLPPARRPQAPRLLLHPRPALGAGPRRCLPRPAPPFPPRLREGRAGPGRGGGVLGHVLAAGPPRHGAGPQGARRASPGGGGAAGGVPLPGGGQRGPEGALRRPVPAAEGHRGVREGERGAGRAGPQLQAPVRLQARVGAEGWGGRQTGCGAPRALAERCSLHPRPNSSSALCLGKQGCCSPISQLTSRLSPS